MSKKNIKGRTILAIQNEAAFERERQKIQRYPKISEKIANGENITVNQIMAAWQSERAAIREYFKVKLHYLYNALYECQKKKKA